MTMIIVGFQVGGGPVQDKTAGGESVKTKIMPQKGHPSTGKRKPVSECRKHPNSPTTCNSSTN